MRGIGLSCVMTGPQFKSECRDTVDRYYKLCLRHEQAHTIYASSLAAAIASTAPYASVGFLISCRTTQLSFIVSDQIQQSSAAERHVCWVNMSNDSVLKTYHFMKLHVSSPSFTHHANLQLTATPVVTLETFQELVQTCTEEAPKPIYLAVVNLSG